MTIPWSEERAREFVKLLNRDGVNNAAEALGISDKSNNVNKREQIRLRLTGWYNVDFKEIPSVSEEEKLRNIRDQLLTAFLQEQASLNEAANARDKGVTDDDGETRVDGNGSVVSDSEENATGGAPVQNGDRTNSEIAPIDKDSESRTLTHKPTNPQSIESDTVEITGPDGVKYKIPASAFNQLVQPAPRVENIVQQQSRPSQTHTSDTQSKYDPFSLQYIPPTDYPRFANQRVGFAEAQELYAPRYHQTNNPTINQYQFPINNTGTLPKRQILPNPQQELVTPKFMDGVNRNRNFDLPTRYTKGAAHQLNQPPQTKRFVENCSELEVIVRRRRE